MSTVLIRGVQRFSAIFLALTCVPLACSAGPQGNTKSPRRVLVVTVTKGFRHSSIPTAERILGQLADTSGAFTVEYARVEPNDPQFKGADGKPDKAKVDDAIKAVLAEKMSPAALRNYDGVIFANTTGDLPIPDKEAFLAWIKSGKAFMGMHSAADTFDATRDSSGYPPYVEMLGAEFKTHGAQVEVDAINQDKNNPACRHLPAIWKVFDEIYQMKSFDRAKVHGLLTLDKHPNNKTPGDYPVAWCKEYGAIATPVVAAHGAELLMQKMSCKRPGRIFYTSFGHREDLWDPNWKDEKGERKNSAETSRQYQQHILGGIKWALGLEKGNVRPQTAK